MLEARDHNLRLRAQALSSCSVADAMDRRGCWGALPTAIRPMNVLSGRVVFGRAVTVDWKPVRKTRNIRAAGPSCWSEVRDFLLPAIPSGEGYVYVAGAGAECAEFALAGGLSCSYFQQIGFEAVILGGAVRDAKTVTGLEMPVFATNFCCLDTQGGYQVASVEDETVIGAQFVRTGDWIFADCSGVLTIPDLMIEKIIEEAEAVEAAESRVLAKLNSGIPLPLLVDEQEGHI